MKPFVHDDFLLQSERARRLYHTVAAPLPVIDYHSHVSERDLAANRVFANLGELWVAPDAYKHRALRSLGVDDRLITGDASPREKFDQWAAAVPRLLGNPLYHWTALELKNYFGILEPLSSANAGKVWDIANAQLAQPTHTARGFLTQANVEVVCTSDRLLHELDDHAALARSGFATRVLPSVRADDALAIESDGFVPWLRQLGVATGVDVNTLEGCQQALERRLDVFAAHGCRIADHGIDTLDYSPISDKQAADIYARRLEGGETGTAVGAAQAAGLRSSLLVFLARSYARRGWTLQLHLGAQRFTSQRLRRITGPAGGYATIGDTTDITRLCRLLDDLECADELPRTILFTLNPADNAAFATLTGSFTKPGVEGLVQFGPGWWFNDHELGIRAHFETLAHHGVLWAFVGMTTDSRSLLSMSRHEYFRRVLCDYLAAEVERGAFPDDDGLLAEYVRRISYHNARALLAP